jgi:hypothetical protein
MTDDHGDEKRSLPNIQAGYPVHYGQCRKTAHLFGNWGATRMSNHYARQVGRKNIFPSENLHDSRLCFVSLGLFRGMT